MSIWNYQDLRGLRDPMVLPHGTDDLRAQASIRLRA